LTHIKYYQVFSGIGIGIGVIGNWRHRHRWHQQSAALAIGGIGNRRHRQSAASAIGNWQLAIRILLSGGNM
jgi:hypothetical protein